MGNQAYALSMVRLKILVCSVPCLDSVDKITKGNVLWKKLSEYAPVDESGDSC